MRIPNFLVNLAVVYPYCIRIYETELARSRHCHPTRVSTQQCTLIFGYVYLLKCNNFTINRLAVYGMLKL